MTHGGILVVPDPPTLTGGTRYRHWQPSPIRHSCTPGASPLDPLMEGGEPWCFAMECKKHHAHFIYHPADFGDVHCGPVREHNRREDYIDHWFETEALRAEWLDAKKRASA